MFLYSRNNNSDQKIESDFFKTLDTKVSEIYEIILENKIDELDDENRSLFTSFLIGLFFRHPENIKKYKDAAPAFYRNLISENEEKYQEDRESNWPETLDDLLCKYQPQLLPNLAIDSIPRLIKGTNDDTHHNKLNNMFWHTIDVSDLNFSVLTSDNPLFIDRDFKDNKAVLSLPLSPNKIFIASPIKLPSNLKHEQKRQIVSAVNRGTIKNFTNFIISNEQCSDELITKTLNISN